MKRDIFEEENGREPGPLEFCVDAHKNKSGTCKENSDSEEFVDTAKAMIAERLNNSSSLGDVESEVFNEHMYEFASVKTRNIIV